MGMANNFNVFDPYLRPFTTLIDTLELYVDYQEVRALENLNRQ